MIKKYLIINNNVVNNIILAQESWLQLNGYSYIEYNDALHLNVNIGDTYNNGIITPQPIVEQEVKVVDPMRLRLALNQLGLRSTVETAIANSGDQTLKDAWEYAISFNTESPLLKTMAYALGLTDEDLKNLFILASKIEL